MNFYGTEDLVIGGYKLGPDGFDYLLVGYYEGKDLIFIAKIRNALHPHCDVRSPSISHAFASHNVPSQTSPNPQAPAAAKR